MRFINFLKERKEFVLLIILPIIFFYKVIIYPHAIIYNPQGDLAIYSAWKDFMVNSLRTTGTIPLWNTSVFSGASYIGDPFSAMFYPLNLVYLLFPVDKAFGYLFTINFVLMGIFTYLFCREIKLNKFSALATAIISTFGSTFAIIIFPGHIDMSDSIIWFPALLLSFELSIQKRKLSYGITSGIILALMLLTGFIQTVTYGLTAALIYFLLRLISEYRKNIWILIKLCMIPILTLSVGFLLSAIQLLPNMEFSKLSIRHLGLSYQFASDFSLRPYQLISVLFPHFFGSPLDNTWWAHGNFWSSSIYMGILSVFFAVLAVIWNRNKYVKIFLLLIVFSLVYSFGSNGPLFPFFFKYIPEFNNFRAAARFSFVFGFSLSIIAGFGLNYFFEKNNYFDKKITTFCKNKLFLGTIISLFCVLLFLAITPFGFQFYNGFLIKHGFAIDQNHSLIYSHLKQDVYLFLFFAFSLTIIVMLKIKKIVKINFLKLLVIILIIMDLWIFINPFLKTGNLNRAYQIPNALKFIKKDHSKFRIFDLTGKTVTLTGKINIETITGNSSMYLYYVRDFLWAIGPHANTPYESSVTIYSVKNVNVLKMLNVKYIISKNSIFVPDTKKVYEDNQYKVYQLEKYMPRALFVPNAIATNSKNILPIISKDLFDFTNDVYIEKSINHSLSNATSAGNVTIKSYMPNQITLNVNSTGPGFLLLSEVWYPGWKAYANGKEVAVIKSDDIFRSIFVNKGNTNIEFIYKPFSYELGKGLTLATLILLLLYLVLKYKIFILKWIK